MGSIIYVHCQDLKEDNNKSIIKNKNKNKNNFIKNIKKIFNILFIICLTIIIAHKALYKVLKQNIHLTTNIKDNILYRENSLLPYGFYYLNNNNTNGPITVNRKKDDGTKINFYDIVSNPTFFKEEDSLYESKKIAIVMFANKIKVNSIYENAVSEVYQYAKIHDYDLILNKNIYNKEKSLYYMKLSVLLETVFEGFNENKYDWIFWVDSDVSIANPRIKLETFLPEDENIHFMASVDHNGLNAGVFFLRVHPWSYNLLVEALSYPDYHKERFLLFKEQTCLNNILSRESEFNHYAIVPNQWFNRYFNDRTKGDFLIHYAGPFNKNKHSRMLRKEINQEWYESRNNTALRQEVLDYYLLPKSDQYNNGILTELTYDDV